jgi:hypothetical protein
MSSSVSITNNINNPTMQGTYNSLGLGPIPAGTTADAAVTAVEKVLFKNLQTGWPSTAAPYDPTQQDSGIMGPWSDNVAGTAPPCVVQQVTLDFNSWGLPNDPPTISAIGSEITQQISDNGGLTGVFYGKQRLGGSETIYWGVGFATGVIVDSPEEFGIIYVFAAAFGIN